MLFKGFFKNGVIFVDCILYLVLGSLNIILVSLNIGFMVSYWLWKWYVILVKIFVVFSL